ncbi:uracil-DNA glycosylase family protein [Pelagicoccus sp. SDUM812003]|uniref:uracil-DNA glycosylase family protein n=1 Tax=Pelagicoccus sp. SDUM812003 TaxID=3041267 RepID=UPI00280EC1DD|nr:uracil-DNA glycosylase family protein [Pelagicoccus sp. SDUM812003]MDQ8202453.1 single-stranded DNA-binding protein [Pelagicoccus sp. SDUM812003]
MSLSAKMIQAAEALSEAVDALRFAPPVAYVYNPIKYAWQPHREYLRRYADTPKRVVFLGMNPGPWGMAQTGVPFGEIDAVKNWMGIEKPVDIPFPEHPKRPILGFACEKSEVSGRRLWGLFAEAFPNAADFFADHFVLNYCPLVFMEESSRNRTPDKLPAAESAALFAACDLHLRRCIETLQPEWIVGVGGFAQARAKAALDGIDIQHGKVLHPSPASPAANRGWSEAASKQLAVQGIWQK